MVVGAHTIGKRPLLSMLLNKEFASVCMIPLVITGYSGFSSC